MLLKNIGNSIIYKIKEKFQKYYTENKDRLKEHSKTYYSNNSEMVKSIIEQ
jgi:hypothetical protein